MMQTMLIESQYIVKFSTRLLIVKLHIFATLFLYVCKGYSEWENVNHVRKILVGHFFIDEIPYDAFGCNLTRVQVVERNIHYLPDWMSVDASNGKISGVPQEDDTGTYHIAVTGIGINGQSQEFICKSFAKTFIVEIATNSLSESLSDMIQNSTYQYGNTELSSCRFYSSIVIGTLIVYHKDDNSFINLPEFAHHLQNVLNVSAGLIQLLKEGNSLLLYRQLTKISILHAEDSRNNIPHRKAIYVSWPITCGAFNLGSYVNHNIHRRSIEYSSSLSIGSFHLTSGDFGGLSHLRKRRAVFFGSVTALEGTPRETSSLPSIFSTSVLFTSVQSIINQTLSTSQINSTSSFNYISSSLVPNTTVFSETYRQSIVHMTSRVSSVAASTSSSYFTISSYQSLQSATESSRATLQPKSSMPYSSLPYSSLPLIQSSAPHNMSVVNTSLLSNVRQPSVIHTVSSSPSVTHTMNSTDQSSLMLSRSTILQNTTKAIHSTSATAYSSSANIFTTRFNRSRFVSLTETVKDSRPTISSTLIANVTSFTKSLTPSSTSLLTSSMITSSLKNLISIVTSSEISPATLNSTSLLTSSEIKSSSKNLSSTVTSSEISSATLNSTSLLPSSEITSSSKNLKSTTTSIGISPTMTSYAKTFHSSATLPSVVTRVLSTTGITSSKVHTKFSDRVNKTIQPTASRSFFISKTFTLSYAGRSLLTSLKTTFMSTSRPNESSVSMIKTKSSVFTRNVTQTNTTSKVTLPSSVYPSSSPIKSSFIPLSSVSSPVLSSILKTAYFSSMIKKLNSSLVTNTGSQTIVPSAFTSTLYNIFSSKASSLSLGTITKSFPVTSTLSSYVPTLPSNRFTFSFPMSTSVISYRQEEASTLQGSSIGSSFHSAPMFSSAPTSTSSSVILSQSSLLNTTKPVIASITHLSSTITSFTGFIKSESCCSSQKLSFSPAFVSHTLTDRSLQHSMSHSVSIRQSVLNSSYTVISVEAINSTLTSSFRQESTRKPFTATHVSYLSSSVRTTRTARFTSDSFFSGFSSVKGTVIASYSTKIPHSLFTLSSVLYTISSLNVSFTGLSTLPSIVRSTSGFYSTISHIPNSGPQMLNSIGRLTAYVGRLFVFKIPYDTFYDLEEGFTRNLKLICRYSNGYPILTEFWINFDNTSQTISGLPLESDRVSQTKTGLQLELLAFDRLGSSARDIFSIYIQKIEVSLLFSITATIQYDYVRFVQDSSLKIKLLNRIIQFYNTSISENYYTSRIRNGSVLFSWSDTGVDSTSCNKTLISIIYGKVRLSSGSPTPEFSQALLPEFPVIKLNMSYEGICLLPPTLSPTPTGPVVVQRSNNVFVMYVVPLLAVAFISAIIIATIVMLSKKRRGKPPFLDKYTFKKGQPVLLPEEHELKTFPSSAVILPEDYIYEKRPGKDKQNSEDYVDNLFDDEDGLIKENEAYGLRPLVNPPPPYHPEPKMNNSRRDDYESPYLYPPPTYQLPPLYIQPDDMTSEV